jgi:N6-L-threonylcarbamoyladenine synthase
MINSLKVLGIESSCDDTAAAIVKIYYEDNKFINAQVKSSIVFNQDLVHNEYGGVVPELAARAHTEKLDICVEAALEKSESTLNDLDIISVTSGPGLIGGLLSGVMFAKALALGLQKPLIGVNHLAGHALTPRLTHSIQFPYLILLVSGGHCQFLIVKSASEFSRLGGTIDDAPGEAFDKTAKILGLGYPGGPTVEKRALNGDPHAFKLPRPLIQQKNCDMSFSGLKTALRREFDLVKKNSIVISDKEIDNLCASFQKAVEDVFVSKSKRAMQIFKRLYPNLPQTISIVGGVAANKSIGLALSKIAKEFKFNLIIPVSHLCTDNAAIIASAGAELYLGNNYSKTTLIPRPRWPLDESAKPMIGSGKRGRKV